MPLSWPSIRSMARWVLPVFVGPSTAVTPRARTCGLKERRITEPSWAGERPPWYAGPLRIRGRQGRKSRRRVKRRRLVALNVQIGDAERVLLDELAPRLDHVAHQLAEEVVGVGRVLDLDLEQRAHVAVERRLPKLLRGHFAKAFVALQLQALAALRHHSV